MSKENEANEVIKQEKKQIQIIKKAHPKFIEAIIFWRNSSPYFYVWGLNTTFYEDNSCPTAGVTIDHKTLNIKIFYNKEFIDNLSIEQIQGVLVHEYLHLINLSHSRGKHVTSHHMWNIATDYCINHEINSYMFSGKQLQLPENTCDIEILKKEHNYQGNIISEEIYKFLMEKFPPINISFDADGKGTVKQGEGPGTPFDSHKGLKEAMEKEGIESSVQDKIVKEMHEKAQAYHSIFGGSTTGDYVDKINNMINKSKRNWRRYLRKAINNYILGKSYMKKSSWSKKSRRNSMLPGRQKLSYKVHLYVDTSGSISDEDMERFFSEIEKISDYSQIELIQWDTEIKSSKKYRKGIYKSIQIHGRGGTNVQCVFDRIKDKKNKSNLHIIFTDGYFYTDNIENYNINNVLWVVINNPNFSNDIGRILKIEKKGSN